MPKKDTTYDRIERSLFKDRGESALQLSPKEMEIKNRMMLCVSKKMESPLIEDQELVTFLMHGCGGQAEPVSQSQAYRDIGMINRLVGNIQLAAKSWYRYMIVEGGKKAFQLAIDNGDAKGAAAALAATKNLPTALGVLSINETHDAEMPVGIIKYMDGKRKYIGDAIAE